MERSARAAIAGLLMCIVVGVGGACVPDPDERMPLAVRQAARDLRCGENDLTGRYLGERLFSVAGCGRRATYRVICKITVHTCYLIGGPDDSERNAR
jgi:hypothetical protein